MCMFLYLGGGLAVKGGVRGFLEILKVCLCVEGVEKRDLGISLN